MRLLEKLVMRLVLDTNILISALLRKNTPPYLLYQQWREHQFYLVTSDQQLEELQRVMSYPKLKRYFTAEEARKMLVGITIYSVCISSLPTVNYSPDPDDNLISGDKSDLLKFNRVETIPIIIARQALIILQ